MNVLELVLIEEKMIGKKFGRLIVESFSHSEKQSRFWRCKCECGNFKLVKTKYLNKGDTKSCGCLAKESSSKNAKGMYLKSSACQRIESIYKDGKKHPLYNVWKGINQRCYNSNCREYKWYGSRGIKVHEDWKNNAPDFIKWGESKGYKKGLQIDRIDRNKNYEPANCEFVSRKENLRRMHDAKKNNHS